ncbi:hypothetical protein ACHAXR_005487 [Thalassiosira sp. AJA248-18]
MLNEGLQIQNIGEYSFCGCSLLESIYFPSTVLEVDDYRFSRCSNLREVVLNEGLPQKIGDYACYFCLLLESVKFPSTLTEVGRYAFNGCSNLRKALLNEGPKKIGFLASLWLLIVGEHHIPLHIKASHRALCQGSQTQIEKT